MLITKEQQEALLNKYIKEKHNNDECIGFVDGLNAMLGLISMKGAQQDCCVLSTQNVIKSGCECCKTTEVITDDYCNVCVSKQTIL